MENTNIIEMKNICKNYGTGLNEVTILKNINISIKKGEFVAIMGTSGSGKSTLMNIMGCLDTASSGEYFINNESVKQLKSDDLSKLRRQYFGFIFQRYNLIPTSSALQNVELPAVYTGLDSTIRKERAISLLNKLGLSDKISNKPNELSGGQQQRVSIARALMALMNGGEIIFADEPTGALDSHSGEIVMETLNQLHKEGHTIILVTHDKNVANHA